MSSKRRLRRKCQRKVSYHSAQAAYASTKSHEKRLRFMQPYRCRQCGEWHLQRSVVKTLEYVERERAR